MNYLTFGFVSPIVGGMLFLAALAQYLRARAKRNTTGEAALAMFVSVAIAVVPFVALLQYADYS